MLKITYSNLRCIIYLLLFLLFINSPLAASQVATDFSAENESWPMYNHDFLHSAHSKNKGVGYPWLKWEHEVIGSIESQSVIDNNGTVYVTSYKHAYPNNKSYL